VKTAACLRDQDNGVAARTLTQRQVLRKKRAICVLRGAVRRYTARARIDSAAAMKDIRGFDFLFAKGTT